MEATHPGFTVIPLPGESSTYVAPRVRSDLQAALRSGAPLLVDLTQATFIDAAIVGILLESLADCELHERPLLLLLPESAAPEVRALFELTGLAGLLPLVGSWEEAVRRTGGYAPAPGWTSPVS